MHCYHSQAYAAKLALASPKGAGYGKIMKAISLVALMVFGCIALSPWLLPHPLAVNLDAILAAPSATHWLGTDDLGRDVLARLLAGVQVSVLVAAGVLVVTAAIGIPLGLLAGWYGGWLDGLITKACEVVLSFPGILLALALAALLGGSLVNVIIALGVLGWVGFCRLTRVQVQVVRNQPYLAAAVLAGVPKARLWWRHLLPNVLGPLRVEALLVLVGSIVAEAGLSFLGLGIPSPQPSLGGMLRDGLREVLTTPLLVLAPALVLISLTLALHFIMRASQGRAGNGMAHQV